MSHQPMQYPKGRPNPQGRRLRITEVWVPNKPNLVPDEPLVPGLRAQHRVSAIGFMHHFPEND